MEEPRRDFVGYGPNPSDPKWPDDARIALNFVINYEEGAEYSILEGDGHAETLLSEQPTGPPLYHQRNRNMESMYEFGSRVGIWRLINLFASRKVAPTAYIVGRALELNPAVGEAFANLGSDMVCHGWRWIDYQSMNENEEREHIARSFETVQRLTGVRPEGWYTGRPSLNTRRLIVEHGGFRYDCDDYNDELPYWLQVAGRRHLVIPHSFDTNDSRFARGSGLETAGQFTQYLADSLDWVLSEDKLGGRMMTVPLHARIIGRPGRIAGLARFLDYALNSDRVWIAKRSQIAAHWERVHG
jgi:allantoinase